MTRADIAATCRRIVARIDRRAVFHALPFAVLIVLASGLSYRYHLLLQQQRLRVEHTYDVLAGLEATLVAAIDAETGQRGYVITGDDGYLQPYATARRDVPVALAAVRRLVVDSPAQLARLDDVRRSLDEKFGELDETIAARERDGLDAARVVVMRGRGRAAMDRLRSGLAAMKRHELALLAERAERIRRTEHGLLAITLACTTLSIVARLGLGWLAARRLPA